MKKIDRKFKFVAVNPCNGKTYTEDNAFIICAKDMAAIPALNAYMKRCASLGCDDSHLESISMLIDRVQEYQEEMEVRIPDTETPCEVDRCIGGKDL